MSFLVIYRIAAGQRAEAVKRRVVAIKRGVVAQVGGGQLLFGVKRSLIEACPSL